MRRRISLAEAFNLLKQVRQSELKDTSHLSISKLYNQAQQIYQKGGRVLETEVAQHALECPRCFHELTNFFKGFEEGQAWDVVLPRAASGGEQLIHSVSVDGTYTVTIRRSLSDRRKALITIDAATDYGKKLDGETIIVRDRKHRVLLKGAIVCGRVSQEIEDTESFDLTCMTINTKSDAGDEQTWCS